MSENVKVGDGVAYLVDGDTMVSMWKLPATVERAKWLYPQVVNFIRKHQEGGVHVMFILPSSDPPGADARAIIQASLKEAGDTLRRFIVVTVGDTVRMNLVRTIGRSIVFLAGKSHLLRLVGNIDEARDQLAAVAKTNTPPSSRLKTFVATLAAELSVDVGTTPGLNEK